MVGSRFNLFADLVLSPAFSDFSVQVLGSQLQSAVVGDIYRGTVTSRVRQMGFHHIRVS